LPAPWQVAQPSAPGVVNVTKWALADVLLWHEPQAAWLGPTRTDLVGSKVETVPSAGPESTED